MLTVVERRQNRARLKIWGRRPGPFAEEEARGTSGAQDTLTAPHPAFGGGVWLTVRKRRQTRARLKVVERNQTQPLKIGLELDLPDKTILHNTQVQCMERVRASVGPQARLFVAVDAPRLQVSSYALILLCY